MEHAPKKKKLSDWLWIATLVVGLVTMLYPLSSTLVNNRYLSKVAEETETRVEALPEEEKDAKWQEMLDYNTELILHPVAASESINISSHDPYNYAGTLEDTDVLSQIVIPDIDVSLPVYRGTSDKVLARGAGHLYGTTLPTGGEGSNTAISAHTGMINASMFDNLPKLNPGDDIYLTTLNHKIRYQMVDSKVVPPDSIDAIPLPGVEGDHLYLITCTPYGMNTNRLIVHAVRAPLQEPEPNLADMSNSVHVWKWWMYLSLAAAGVVLLVVLFSVLRRNKKRETTTRHDLP